MRVPPALVTQRPFIQGHGDYLAAELDLNKLGHPVLNHRDGVYLILDGQHRIYALKANGFDGVDVVECDVYENLNDAEMARMFLGLNTRRAVNPMSNFHIAVTGKMERETAILSVVESLHLKVGRAMDDNTVGSVGTLAKIYDRWGVGILKQTLRTVQQAWGGSANSFQQSILEGLALIYSRYGSKVGEMRMVESLGKATYGVRGILTRAASQRERTGNQKAQCVASTMVDIYNKSVKGPRSQFKLPSWWKQVDDAVEAPVKTGRRKAG